MTEVTLRVLLVEDDWADAELISIMFEGPRSGMALVRTDRLSGALNIIEQEEFDAILLDLGLPDSVGLDALHKIQIKAPKMPVIILTGLADEEVANSAIVLGAQDYLVKGDFDRKLLRRCIHYAIQRKEAQEALEMAYEEVDFRIKERTQELAITNEELLAQITQHRQTESELAKAHQQMRELAANLRSIREEERTRIARDIHDDLGQTLTALKMDLAVISERAPEMSPKEISARLDESNQLVLGAIQTVKRICTELRPAILDHLGLSAALEWQAEEFQKRSGIQCRIKIDEEHPSLDPELVTALFRIFQEALTNVLKHANATAVIARLVRLNGNIVLEISDNGIGITKEQLSKTNSFGLLGIRERVYPWRGSVRITGKPGTGTNISVCVPAVQQ